MLQSKTKPDDDMKATITWGIICPTLIELDTAVLPSLALLQAGQPLTVCEIASDCSHKRHDQATFVSLEALINDPNIQAVYVSVPQNQKQLLIQQLAKAGKHICVEAPLASNLEEAQQTLQIVKQNKIICLEAFALRFHPIFRHLQVLLASGEIGQVHYFHAQYTAEKEDFASLAALPIALIRNLAGAVHRKHAAEPDDLFAMGTVNAIGQLHDAAVLLNFPNHMRASVRVAKQASYLDLTVYGTNGGLHLAGNPDAHHEAMRLNLIDREGRAHALDVALSQPSYYHLFQAMQDFIAEDAIGIFSKNVTWMDSLGNLIAVEAWQRQIEDRHTKQEADAAPHSH